MSSTRSGRPAGQRGMALAVALVTLMILTVMGLALGSMGIENLNQIRRTADSEILVQAANGGLNELMDRIYGDGSTTNGQFGKGVTDSSADGSGAYATSLKGCRYWWTFNPSSGQPYCTNNLDGKTPVTGWNGMTVPPCTALLVASADVAAPPDSQDPVRVVALASNRFPYAIASDGTIDINHVTSLIPGWGHVRSNNTTGTTSQPNIDAEAIDGMTFSRNGPGTIEVSAPSGPQFYDQPKMPIPDIPIASIVQSYSTAGTSGAHPYGGPATIQIPGPGPHAITNLADGTLTVDGIQLTPLPVSVYIDGTVKTSGGGNLTIPQGLHLFVKGDMTVSGSLNEGTTPAPSPGGTSTLPLDKNFLFVTGDMTFNGSQGQGLYIMTGGNVRQNGTSDYRGLIYTQGGSVQFNGGGLVTGSIISKAGVSTSGDLTAGNLDVNFDPSVFDSINWLGFSVLGPVRTVSWYIQK